MHMFTKCTVQIKFTKYDISYGNTFVMSGKCSNVNTMTERLRARNSYIKTVQEVQKYSIIKVQSKISSLLFFTAFD